MAYLTYTEYIEFGCADFAADKIKKLGFRFQFRNIKKALKDCLKQA